MAKDPAVLFYTSDFLSGTYTMTNDQVGKYIRLLCLQHQKGGLTEKDMLNICSTYDEDIFSKFKLVDGCYINERMMQESVKRRKYSESRRNNKMASKAGQHMKNICRTYVEHMENENSIVKSNTNTVTTEFSLQHCKEIALRDQSWVSKNKITPQAIDRFIEAMLKDGDYVKTPKDFKKHCRRWLDIQKQEPTTRKLNIL
jgi:hypothetical protein